MADIVIPAGAVTCRDGDLTDTRKAQVAISGGQAVYIDTANGYKFNLCDADAQASAKFHGIAVSDAAIGEYCTVALPGAVITVASATFTAGLPAWLSTTAGAFTETWADLLTGDYPTIGYIGITTTTALVVRVITDVTKA